MILNRNEQVPLPESVAETDVERERQHEERETERPNQLHDAVRKAEAASEEPKTIVQRKMEQLDTDREVYLDVYKRYAESKEKEDHDALGTLFGELEEKRGTYLSAKKGYGEALVASALREWVREGKKGSELNALREQYIRTEIFQRLVVEEENLLIERRSADYPPQIVGVLRRLYQKWDNLPIVHKTLITTAVTTGLAFTVTAGTGKGWESVESTGVALFFSKAFLLNLGQDVFTGFVGSGVNQVLTNKMEQGFQMSIEEQRGSFILEKLDEMSGKYHDLLEKKMRTGALVSLGSALATVASGRLFSMGIEMISQASVLKEAITSMSDQMMRAPDAMSRLTETETVTKGGRSFFRQIARLFGNTIDNK